MRKDLSWAKTDILELLPTFTAAEAQRLGNTMFTAACERRLTPEQNIDVLDTIRSGLSFYEARADGDEQWEAVVTIWRKDQRVYELTTLTDQLRGVERFTDKHLEIMLDPQRNTVLNGFGLLRKVDAYYEANPSARRAANYAGRTYLFNASETCRHAVASAPGGGVKCSKCTGWFCF